MLGRNVDQERGVPGRTSPANSMSSHDEELMGQATQCVRKFAPEGRRKMRRTDNGHITACKISDANPNEMIASWSGDHIYSFDLVRSPDATHNGSKNASASISGQRKGKFKESGDRKRKRKKESSSTSLVNDRDSSKSRRAKDLDDDDGELSLRVRYENGQTEDIAMEDAVPNLPETMAEEVRESVLNEAQKRSLRIAKSVVKIRKMLFSLDASDRASHGSLDGAYHTSSFTSVLGLAATCMPEMDEISRSWRYPIDPFQEDVLLQNTLRANRESSRRFVQAAGTLAKMLGGKIQTASNAPSPALDAFQEMESKLREGPHISLSELFCYDFLKAITLWLDGGPEALLQGFRKPSWQSHESSHHPIPSDADLGDIHEYLIPHLLRMARDSPLLNINASRFERDETRQLFGSETAAVIAFSNAARMPFEDPSRDIMPAPGGDDDDTPRPLLQDRNTAMRYWGFKVGRSVLMKAGEGVNFQFVDMAFGGLGTSRGDGEKLQEDVDPEEAEELVENVTLVKSHREASPRSTTGSGFVAVAEGSSEREGFTTYRETSPLVQSDIDLEDAGSDTEVILMDDLHDEIADQLAAVDDDEDEDNDDNNDDDSDDNDEGDGDITAEERQFMFQSASDRGKLRERVEKDVPCYSHTRKYTGHCNVKTVKDANFFGLQDEYVISGSDGGHLFIWDKKTSQLVNILEGDNEVVNVAQGKLLLPCRNYPTGVLTLTAPTRPPVRAPHRCLRYRPHHQNLLSRHPRSGRRRSRHQHLFGNDWLLRFLLHLRPPPPPPHLLYRQRRHPAGRPFEPQANAPELSDCQPERRAETGRDARRLYHGEC